MAGQPTYHHNCILLRGITGSQRGANFGYRYVAGQVSNVPVGGAAPPGTGNPPAGAGNCPQASLNLGQGDRYDGMVCNGKKHGRGVFTGYDGLRYDGEWKNDVIDGQGVADFPNGASYQGQWRNGKPNGYGTYRNETGVYSGNWSNG